MIQIQFRITATKDKLFVEWDTFMREDRTEQEVSLAESIGKSVRRKIKMESKKLGHTLKEEKVNPLINMDLL